MKDMNRVRFQPGVPPGEGELQSAGCPRLTSANREPAACLPWRAPAMQRLRVAGVLRSGNNLQLEARARENERASPRPAEPTCETDLPNAV
ncbi:hypothetical protein SKAU_G00405740 [Synaphobranchus kaupii]|uniref:Uncharacterized protein n=1 Tax=Synaphobranchus kaupii TaxID=118154 RepID=A0A9Q1IC03_SYNKA|nr:hypothetical protein SKAU_G00405740 [Synaphobranchus kaupii]